LGIARADLAHTLARSSADRALSIDPNSAEAHAAKGMLFHHQWDFANAERELRLALVLDSGNGSVRQQYAINLGMNGRIEEAITESRRVLEYDPLAVDALVGLAYFLICARRYREAIGVAQGIFEIDSTSLFGYSNLGLAYGFAGLPDSAVIALAKAYRLDPDLIGNGAYLALGYALAGRRSDVARQVATEKRRGVGNSPHFITAILDLAEGKFAEALVAIERGVQRHEPLFRSVSLGCDPIFDVLKSNSRFTALLNGMDQRICPPGPTYPIAASPVTP
jgi:tetratricopeptide (TPR) repeat protein